MTQLYTVKIKQKHLVSTFDAAGKKTGERTDFIEVTHTDLPISTAKMYQEKVGKEFVEIIAQSAVQGQQTSKIANHSARRSEAPSARVASKTKPNSQTAIQKAAASGDMAAALNRGA